MGAFGVDGCSRQRAMWRNQRAYLMCSRNSKEIRKTELDWEMGRNIRIRLEGKPETFSNMPCREELWSCI